MRDLSLTSTMLLSGLADSKDQTSWQEFDARYRPILLGVIRRMGLDADAAADVVQETLVAFLGAWRAGQYDRSRGRLGHWLCGFARNRVRDLGRRKREPLAVGGNSWLGELPEENHLEELWEQESRAEFLCQALELLRRRSDLHPETILAFERYALRDEAPEVVARDLGLTVNAVYMAKHHCLKLLRGLTSQLESSYDL